MNDSYDYFYEDPQDFRSDPDSGSFRQKPSGSRPLATAAFVLCLISGITFFICYLSIPLASLAIILALLSRGSGKTSIRGKIAIIISIIDISLSFFFTASAVYSVLNDPVQRRQLEALWDYYMDYYGDDLDTDTIRDYLDYFDRHSDQDSKWHEDFVEHEYSPDDDLNRFLPDFSGQEFVSLEDGTDSAVLTWQNKGGVWA